MIDDFEQLPVGWQVSVGVAVLTFSVWVISGIARDLQRKDREQRWNRSQRARSTARNASKANTGTATETPGTSPSTKGPSAPAGYEAVQLPESPAREERGDRRDGASD